MRRAALLGMVLWCNSTAWAVPGTFVVCSEYECSRRDDISLTDAQWQEIRALFTPTAASAQEERAALRRAIARMEDFVGALNGTSADLGGNFAGSGMAQQMDCIDESSNTTTYLRLFQESGLLRWHEVQERARRARWIFDAHWTAVIRDTATGQLYAVDSWFLDNGQPPYIQRLEDWRGKKDFDE
ncbi:MAG TPA: hypothetical protein VN418_00960 [Gammaproteobacteria bacterium]|nr:hypothetical protein [Gammaproteobacteria bacterium]